MACGKTVQTFRSFTFTRETKQTEGRSEVLAIATMSLSVWKPLPDGTTPLDQMVGAFELAMPKSAPADVRLGDKSINVLDFVNKDTAEASHKLLLNHFGAVDKKKFKADAVQPMKAFNTFAGESKMALKDLRTGLVKYLEHIDDLSEIVDNTYRRIYASAMSASDLHNTNKTTSQIEDEYKTCIANAEKTIADLQREVSNLKGENRTLRDKVNKVYASEP